MLKKYFKKNDKTVMPEDIDLSSIPYYPLPPSPSRWEIDVKEKEDQTIDKLFQINNPNKDYFSICSVNKLEMEERPDPAYKEILLLNFGSIFIDKKGNVKKFQNKKASLLLRGVDGKKIKELGLEYDIYRIGSNPHGSFLVFMSSDCILHAYDENLSLVHLSILKGDSRIQMVMESDLVMWGEMRTKIRCVDISHDGESILFTIADTAYLINKELKTIWAIAMPLNDGWERVFAKCDVFGQRDDIKEALTYMGLRLPVTQSDIKSRYRKVALQWHPDRNPNNAESTKKMQLLNNKFSILTGLDPSSLEISSEKEILQYRRTKADYSYSVSGLTIEMNLGGPGLDWIYAAKTAT